jgi:hypothetical protein
LTDKLENSLVLKELGFDSVWLLKEKTQEVEKIYHAYTLNLTDCNILFVASSNITSEVEEGSLFKNIALYLHNQSINETLKLSLSLDRIKIKETIKSSKFDHLFLLCTQLDFLDKEYQLANKNKVFLSVPLSKIIQNSELKQKLWHDIQVLLNKVNEQ